LLLLLLLLQTIGRIYGFFVLFGTSIAVTFTIASAAATVVMIMR